MSLHFHVGISLVISDFQQKKNGWRFEGNDRCIFINSSYLSKKLMELIIEPNVCTHFLELEIRNGLAEEKSIF